MIIFIAGAHAVGKSTLCDEYAQNSDFIFKSSSELIKEGQMQNWDNDKTVSDPKNNQLTLIKRINEFKNKNVNLLLDGHFVLRNKDNEFTNLDSQVFEELNLDGVILIECDGETIRKRFASRGATLSYDPEKLGYLERQQAESICSKLAIPLTILVSPDYNRFAKAVQNLTA